MDVSINDIQLQHLKISECEVCSQEEAKYTCPRCELRTCCLKCVNIHKKELDCNGLRDKVKFKMLKNFDNIDLLNDYRLLEETARVVNKSVKLPDVSCYNARSGTLPTDLYRLKCTALSRGVQLHFLPPNFSRHRMNTSHLDHETQSLYWRVDWLFVQAENISLTDERVLDSTVLSACVHKYIEPEEKTSPLLSYYQAAGHSGIKLLMKAERTAPNRFYLLDPTLTLRENLSGKAIIEYPVIHVVQKDHIYMFNVFTEEDEENLKKTLRTRNHNRGKNSSGTANGNLLFSNEEELEISEGAFDSNTGRSNGKFGQHKRNFNIRHKRGGYKQNYSRKKRGMPRTDNAIQTSQPRENDKDYSMDY